MDVFPRPAWGRREMYRALTYCEGGHGANTHNDRLNWVLEHMPILLNEQQQQLT